MLPSGGSTSQQTNARQAVGSPECPGFHPTSHPRYLHLQVGEGRGGEGNGGKGKGGEQRGSWLVHMVTNIPPPCPFCSEKLKYREVGDLPKSGYEQKVLVGRCDPPGSPGVGPGFTLPHCMSPHPHPSLGV